MHQRQKRNTLSQTDLFFLFIHIHFFLGYFWSPRSYCESVGHADWQRAKDNLLLQQHQRCGAQRVLFCNHLCSFGRYRFESSFFLSCSFFFTGALRLWDLRSGDGTQEMKDSHTKQITRLCSFLCCGFFACFLFFGLFCSVSVGPSSDFYLLSNSRDNLLK